VYFYTHRVLLLWQVIYTLLGVLWLSFVWECRLPVTIEIKRLTAGSAKKEIAKTEKHEATIFPIHVWGTVSPYPIVVTVICSYSTYISSCNTSQYSIYIYIYIYITAGINCLSIRHVKRLQETGNVALLVNEAETRRIFCYVRNNVRRLLLNLAKVDDWRT